jgi:predicted RNA-binding protein (virulence factor B family)
MTRLGTFNELEILRLSPKGAHLRGDGGKELLLPANEVPPEAAPGASLKVFLYLDGNDRPAATTHTPAASVREVAYLKITAVTDAGAFLDWGLPKDLLLPWNEVKREQKRLVVEGRKLLVCVFQAEDGRIAASSRLDEFLVDEAEDFQEGQLVSIIIADPTDLGVRVVVDHRVWGMVHSNEIFGKLHRGMKLDGYVKALRPDHKINISLSAPGYQKIDAVSQRVLGTLARRGGFMAVTDKTPAEEIHTLFGISKKVFKQTLGALYRNRNITLEETGIRLLKGPTDR